MDENLYLSPLSIGQTCALMQELRPETQQVTVTRQSKLNDPEPVRRPAARLSYTAWRKSLATDEWQKVLVDRKEAKKQATLSYNEKLAAEREEQKRIRAAFVKKQRAEEAAENADRKAKNAERRQAKNLLSKLLPVDRRIGGQREMQLKDLPAKCFVPVIGNPNTEGETPVQIDHKTRIMVRAGKDVQETIAKYQKLLNLKTA